MARAWNFAAGPAMLPPDVLDEVAARLGDHDGRQISIVELPFTGPEVVALMAVVEEQVRTLLPVPASHRVLFVQGGASLQFSAVPLNLMPQGGGGGADYLAAGYWADRAAGEAARYGRVRKLAHPGQAAAASAYLHVTSCETANGSWLPALPFGEAPLVVDATADLFSRHLPIEHCGLVYASAQKNFGIAGLTLVIVHEDLLGRARPETPAMLDYGVVARNHSRACTPPVLALWVTLLMLGWIRRNGGVAAMQAANRRKAAMVYGALEAAGDYYHIPTPSERRADVAVCFRLPTPQLEEAFLAEAAARGLLHLRGHPAIGGVRACLYNAMPEEGAAALADFIAAFAGR